jgi:Rrf2 family protein
MKITYRGDYALKAVLDLALYCDRGLVTIHEMAERIDAPVKFLEQILLDLKKGNFVESRRGKIGGFLLSRPPEEISVGDVVRFIDGPIEPIACVKRGYANCGDAPKCVFKKVWQDVADATSNIVDHVTFAQLADQVNVKQRVLEYSI